MDYNHPDSGVRIRSRVSFVFLFIVAFLGFIYSTQTLLDVAKNGSNPFLTELANNYKTYVQAPLAKALEQTVNTLTRAPWEQWLWNLGSDVLSNLIAAAIVAGLIRIAFRK